MRPHYSILAIAIILSCTVSSFAGDYVSVDHPTSFRGVAWGTPLADIPDLLAVKEKGYKDTYYKPNERMSFGEATLRSVAYNFRDGKLYRVGVAFEGRANHFLIKERLMRMYGPGRGVGARYGWMWPDFSVEITYDDERGSGGLIYTYEGAFK